MKHLKKAFTLVELMVVITVIAILMTIAIVSFTRIQKQSRDTKRKADMRTLQTALQAYYTEFQAYPISTTETAVSQAAPGPLLALTPNYIPSVPTAPGGTSTLTYPSYTYVSGANGYTYAICADLETATGSGQLWVVNTTNPGGYGVTDAAGACSAPANLPAE